MHIAKFLFYISIKKNDENIEKTLENIENSENDLELKRNIEKLSIINKEDVINNSSLYSVEYAFNQENKVIKVNTSGSTGKFMTVNWDKNNMKKSMLSLWTYRYKYYGIKTTDKLCYFYTVGNVKESIENLKEFEQNGKLLGFSKSNLNNERLLKIYNKICDFKPIWMNLQPSIAVLLAEYIIKNKLAKISSLKYIELIGEMLFDNIRKKIKEAFGCVIANQYGCYEANSIAFECPFENCIVWNKIYMWKQ